MLKKTLLIIAIAFSINPAKAEMQGYIMGAGTATCGQFGELYREKTFITEQIFFNWALGFMSGQNAANQNDARELTSMPIIKQEEFLRQYCNEHPLGSYLSGVYTLYLTLKKSS